MLNKYPINQALADYEAEQEARKLEAQHYHSFLGSIFHWKVDAIYEDVIIREIGQRGFELIREFRLMEPCGVINGRKLYAL